MAISNIKGRKKEIAELKRIYNSKKSEFIAICGRRRIGKTFLVSEFFSGKFTFTVAGISKGTFKIQLQNFNNELGRQFPSMAPKTATNWLDAFNNLKICLEKAPGKRKVLFFDELPWMDTPRSGFIPALENFWNAWACLRHDIVLVVCGSSTSWIMDKLINSKGGLHNRLTSRLFLEPLSLRETESMLRSKGVSLSRYETCICYMIFGGIPYYLDYIVPEKSLTENIDDLLFSPSGGLYDEFDNLYAALFKKADDYVNVVKALSKERGGLTRGEIIEKVNISTGGSLTLILKNLQECGFIRTYTDLSKGKPTIYQLIDFYTIFYLRFLNRKASLHNWEYWMSIQDSPTFSSWAGITFELLCISHIGQIKSKLGISAVATEYFGWRQTEGGKAQVDLVILRRDHTANLCEMKFLEAPYKIDKEEDVKLRGRITAFKESLSEPSRSIRLTIVSSMGVKDSKYKSIVSDIVDLDDLFK